MQTNILSRAMGRWFGLLSLANLRPVRRKTSNPLVLFDQALGASPGAFFLFKKLSVRDGGIELPITVWKTVVIPFN